MMAAAYCVMYPLEHGASRGLVAGRRTAVASSWRGCQWSAASGIVPSATWQVGIPMLPIHQLGIRLEVSFLPTCRGLGGLGREVRRKLGSRAEILVLAVTVTRETVEFLTR